MPSYGQEYAWMSGHGVALASLRNIASDIGARNARVSGGALYPVGIRSQPVDLFPVRTMLAAGYERGDGRIDHALEMTITTYGYDYVLDTYLSSGAVVAAAMTFYLRRHETNSFTRFNGYLNLPQRGRDIEYLRQNVLRVTFPLTRLVAL